MIIDNVNCLLLDKRYEYKKRLCLEFSKIGATVNFFLAGDGKLFSQNEYNHIDIEPPTGRYGYQAWVNRPNSYNAFTCFKKMIAIAKDSNQDCVWICEDDVTVENNFLEIMDKVELELQSLPPWDMLYLCANHTWAPTQQLSEHILKLNGSGGFQSVIINKKLFQWFLDVKMTAPIDEIAGKQAHPKFNCYGVWPNICTPMSNILSYCEGYVYGDKSLYLNKGC